jgi:hypothetical protein
VSLDDVLYLKTSAKRARNDKDWAKATRLLGRAVAALDALTGTRHTAASAQKISTELSDTHGMVGGIERRWGLDSTGPERRDHLERSKDAYDKGYGYERELGDRAVTYNRVNRIVARVLVAPEFLQTGDDEVDVHEELAGIERVLLAKLHDFDDDPWAQCDLVMIKLLRGDPATAALDRLKEMQPRRFVYDSFLDTLRPLAEAAREFRPHLVDAVAEVERQRAAANP